MRPDPADIAAELLDLFTHARRALGWARQLASEGGDPEPALTTMRFRLTGAVWDDCLLFDEAAIYALAAFVGAWRAAAADLEAEKYPQFDAELEERHAEVVASLRKCLGKRAVDPLASAS